MPANSRWDLIQAFKGSGTDLMYDNRSGEHVQLLRNNVFVE